MSLLDDVSIVVTPNGYKAGTLYGVLPTATEGSELVTDGNFPTGTTAWTTNGSIANNELTLNGNSTAVYAIQSLFSAGSYNGKILKLTYTVVANTLVGSGVFYVGSYSGSSIVSGTQINLNATVGTHIIYITLNSSGNNNVLDLWIPSSNTSGSLVIDNVSVKEWTASDMDVTRATAATRVDENGLVNYAEILGSEEVVNGDFATDSNWTLANGSSISGGSLTLPDTGTALQTGIPINTSVKLNIQGSGTVTFRLNTGVGFTSISLPQIIYVTTGSSGGRVQLNNVSGSEVTIDNVSVKEVDLNNVPRIDYTGGGCPHILAEPQRTNNLSASQDLTDSFWFTYNMETIVASTVLSPDGTTFGFKAIPNNTNSQHYVNYDFGFLSMPSGVEATYSVFVKSFGYTNFQLASSTSFAARYQNFELTGDGVIGTGDVNSAKIEKIGDWYRCSITETTTGTTPRVLNIATSSSGLGRNPYFTGNGTDGVLLWGAQLEEGTYPTSYIPNLSTTSGSTVTRNQDIFERDGIGSLINSTEGVLFVEIAAFADYTTYRYIGLTDGSSDNRVIILYYNSSTRIRVLLSSGGTKYFDEYYAVTSIEDFHKVALKWKENDFALWIDGVERATDTSGLAPIGLNTVALDQAGGDNFYGKVKQLQVYDTALTDNQLIQLTGEAGTHFFESYSEMAETLTYTIQ